MRKSLSSLALSSAVATVMAQEAEKQKREAAQESAVNPPEFDYVGYLEKNYHCFMKMGETYYYCRTHGSPWHKTKKGLRDAVDQQRELVAKSKN